jgi:putative nucleotidyltransferase with HDIG domain
MAATVQALVSTLEMRDPYTAGHQRRVATLAVAIARELGVPPDAIEGIELAAMVHDVGKVQVPAEILTKPGKLTALEYQLVQVHAQAGYEILKGIDFPWPVAQMVGQHHERMNGSGYPNQLSGDAILLGSRIIAVADVVETMMSHRPYRPALGQEAALVEIDTGRVSLFDPGVVDACLRLFRDQGFGFA